MGREPLVRIPARFGVSLPNGFDGPWNPMCEFCGGYMHTGHTTDCVVTKRREAENARLAAIFARHRAESREESDA